MPRSVLILYSTVDGHTRTICERIAGSLKRAGHRCTVMELVEGAQFAAYDTVVVGASIRYGKHRPLVGQFLNRNASALKNKRTGLFSVNVVARKPQKNTPDTNPYMRKLLGGLAWRPELLAVFAGKLDYPRYDFWDRSIIRLIMWLTRGPTDTSQVFEFTDWLRVDAFATEIGRE